MATDFVSTKERTLSKEEISKLEAQNTRLVSEFTANKLEIDAKKHWDLFYKRNGARFFKDRHWTTREFQELIDFEVNSDRKILLEVGCGVGNFVYPLIEEYKNYFVYACDISSKAIELFKLNKLYNENNVRGFCADITDDNSLSTIIQPNCVDIATLIFVLSAIHPNKFYTSVINIFNVLKPGGIVLFRDYAINDIAQIRFKPGHKISDNFYMRQDGTRSYYFSRDKLTDIFTSCGFEIISNNYLEKRTINKKEEIDVPRNFIQAKFLKPL